MSVSRPNGYRMPSSIGLTTLSRRVVAGGRGLRREEAARIVARVAAMVVESGGSEEVFRKLSHGQLGDDALVMSKERFDTVVARSAEFVDLLNASMHAAFSLPAEPWLDLRFELQFFDDADDPDGGWTYVLLGSENEALEAAWAGIETVERYPIPEPDELDEHRGVDPGLVERETIWARVTAPYVRSSPVSWRAPDPQLLFDIIDSLGHLDGDAARAEAGEITVTLVAEELGRLLAVPTEQAIDLLQRHPVAGA